MLNGNLMECLSTMRPGRMAVYQWDKPLGPFLWPMNTMRRLEDEKDFNYEQLETYMMQSDYYWIARIYKSHSGLLDAYLRFKGEDRVTRYILEFDAADVTMTWPQPCDFYLARRAIRTDETMTLRDYDGGQVWAPMAPPMVPAIPAVLQEAIPEVVGEAIPAAVEEAMPELEEAMPEPIGAFQFPTMTRRSELYTGGTVFLCNGLFFFFDFSTGPGSILSFLIVPTIPFFLSSLLSYLVSNLIISILLLSRFFQPTRFELILIVSTRTFGFETLSWSCRGSIFFEIRILCTIPCSLKKFVNSLFLFVGFRNICNISIFEMLMCHKTENLLKCLCKVLLHLRNETRIASLWTWLSTNRE